MTTERNRNASHGAMRLALLGCGNAAAMHAKTLRSFKRDIVVSFASRNAAKAQRYCATHRGFKAFRSYEEAIAAPDIDVVAILTPPALHLELTLAALAAGKDVIVEKPPFFRAADFDTVQATCIANQRRVFVAENYFYKPLATTLRKLIANRTVGDILFIQLNAVKSQTTDDWRDDVAQTGGGALFEGGIHWINLLANLGLTVTRVRGAQPRRHVDTPDPPVLDRSMLVTFEYAEGAVGTLQYSWEVPSWTPLRMSRIYGTEGSIRFETNGVFVVRTGRSIGLSLPGLRDLAGYKSMFRDFWRAWRNNDEPAMSLAMARRDLELVEQAYATAQTSYSHAGVTL